MKIVLIGFACSYKTSAGKILAEKLGFEFIDIDEQITKIYGESIASIFAEHGEAGFRKRENAVLSHFVANNNIVISCGGGSVLCDNFCDFCRSALVVWLTSTATTVLSRIGEVPRPLFDGMDKNKLEQSIEERSVYYRKYANFTVSTDNLTSKEVAEELFVILQKVE